MPKILAQAITPDTKVADVLAQYPKSLEIFLRYGFTPLRNPILRNTVARAVTIEQACRRENVEMGALMSELKELFGVAPVNDTAL